MDYRLAPTSIVTTTVLVHPMESRRSRRGESTTRKQKKKRTCQQQTLKCLDSRPALIAVCALVVIECICVLVELMVDLQGIKFRFENEEHEIQRFVDYLKTKYPEDFYAFKGRTMEEIIAKIQPNINLKGEHDLYCLPCKCSCDLKVNANVSVSTDASFLLQNSQTVPIENESSVDSDVTEQTNVYVTQDSASNPDYVTTISPTGMGVSDTTENVDVPSSTETLLSESDISDKDENFLIENRTHSAMFVNESGVIENETSSTMFSNESNWIENRTSSTVFANESNVIENRTMDNSSSYFDLSKLFVLEINNIKERFFLVAEYYPDHVAQDDTKHLHYHSEYEKIHLASTAIHLGSLAILSIMVIETFVKLFCMGIKFFKKKFEVFDAFIVIASFALDFIFLDSRWYETGKDATTILVLLLPWRVVRIVNSFLMTVNHKHHIEMMTVKRAKKKSEVKIAKMNTLLAEIRKDVQLLVALCRSRDIPEPEISACVYGKGRHNATIAAMTSFASLMLISTLGKNAIYEDEIYGKLFHEALADDDDDEDENGNDVKEQTDEDEATEGDGKFSKKQDSKKKKQKRGIWKRSNTVPRRSHSLENVENGNVFYVNDGFLSIVPKEQASPTEDSRRASFHSKASVRSQPASTRGRNFVTFEVTTQVTYL